MDKVLCILANLLCSILQIIQKITNDNYEYTLYTSDAYDYSIRFNTYRYSPMALYIFEKSMPLLRTLKYIADKFLLISCLTTLYPYYCS